MKSTEQEHQRVFVVHEEESGSFMAYKDGVFYRGFSEGTGIGRSSAAEFKTREDAERAIPLAWPRSGLNWVISEECARGCLACAANVQVAQVTDFRRQGDR